MQDDADLVFDEKGPERTCIVTRTKGEPRHMMRFVAGPDGTVVPDLRARLPGRGAWVTARADVVATAVKRRSFSRAFKRDVLADPALASQIEGLMIEDSLGALAFANKAGLILAGAFKIEGAVGSGRVLAILHAREGSADGIRKIDALGRRHLGVGAAPPASLQIFSSEQMDLALGRTNVVHAAVLVGGASVAFLEKAARLQRYCGTGTPGVTGGASDLETTSN